MVACFQIFHYSFFKQAQLLISAPIFLFISIIFFFVLKYGSFNCVEFAFSKKLVSMSFVLRITAT